MEFPKITLAQIVALVTGAIYPVLVLIGVDLTPEKKKALDDLIVLAVALLGADAGIRIGRNVGTRAPR